MSVKMMGQIWELDVPHAQMLVLLAMADHADHEGGNIYPSMGLVAWKTGYSERQVQRVVRELIQAGALVKVADAAGRRPATYRMELSNLPRKSAYTPDKMSPMISDRGDKMSPVTPDKMSPLPALGVTFTTARGDIAVSPKPSWEPSERVVLTHEGIAPAAPPPVAPAADEPSAPAQTQTTLTVCLEPPPPVSGPPPAPERKRPARSTVPPEAAAIRQALRDAAEWGPSAKANAQAKQAGDRLMEFDPGVTPEQIAIFAREWFPKFSPQASSAARRGDPLSPPTPEQVVQLWPRFQPWYAGRQQAIAARAEELRRRRERQADEQIGDARLYNPFRGRLRKPIPVATD
jgi:hypothetical protein